MWDTIIPLLAQHMVVLSTVVAQATELGLEDTLQHLICLVVVTLAAQLEVILKHLLLCTIPEVCVAVHIRSSSGDYEVLYFDVEGKKFDPHGSETAKDKVWATNSVKYGEDRAGVQPSGEDRTHITDVNSRDGVLLSGDDFGLVNVFKWPSPALKESRSFAAHSEHVVRVAFGKNFVFSIGG